MKAFSNYLINWTSLFIQKIDFENYNKELANIICEIYIKKQIKMNFNLLSNLLNFITNKKLDCLIQQLNLNKELNCEDINELLNNFDFPYNELCKKKYYPFRIK